MGAPDPEQRKEPRYQVTYHTYLASGRRLSYTPSVECVVGLKYAKSSLLVLQNFAIFRLRHAHVRKDTRLSTAFPYCKRRKAGRGLGTRLQKLEVAKAWEQSYTLTQVARLCRVQSRGGLGGKASLPPPPLPPNTAASHPPRQRAPPPTKLKILDRTCDR